LGQRPSPHKVEHAPFWWLAAAATTRIIAERLFYATMVHAAERQWLLHDRSGLQVQSLKL
jgi:hypothetical protein